VGTTYSCGVSNAEAGRRRAAETKRRRTRAAILGAATRLFNDQGWYPTTVDAIAAEAGVGTATVYKHFANKNVIAGFVFLPVVSDLIGDPRWLDKTMPAPEALRALIVELVAQTRRHLGLTVAMLEAVNDSTARKGTAITPEDPRYVVPLPRVFTDVILRGQASGDFLDYPPAETAGPFFSNLLLLRVFTRPQEPVAETTRLILTVAGRTFGIADLAC
jgi:AcrR family transcriptional regulator